MRSGALTPISGFGELDAYFRVWRMRSTSATESQPNHKHKPCASSHAQAGLSVRLAVAAVAVGVAVGATATAVPAHTLLRDRQALPTATGGDRLVYEALRARALAPCLFRQLWARCRQALAPCLATPCNRQCNTSLEAVQLHRAEADM